MTYGSTTPPPDADFNEVFAPYRTAFEQELEWLVVGRDDPLYVMMRHQLGWQGDQVVSPGKYIRPGLLLLACEACGGDWQQALPAAAALELLHNFSLVHDDIQDESPLRRGRSTVWHRWGAAQAINAGDGMHALSRLALLGSGARGVSDDRTFAAARLLDETCLKLCAGQYDDIAFQDRQNVTLDDYEAMVLNKTAAMFACALQIGAIVAVGQGEISRRLGEAGRAFGVAYQMRDDVLDLWGGDRIGKPVGNDLRRGKKSLPVVLGLSRTGSDADQLRALYARPLDDAAVRQVTSILAEIQVPEMCQDAADQHWDRCKESLRGSGLDEIGAQRLIDAFGSLANREV